jgi:hypothetical protein
VTLLFAVAAFVISDQLQGESGLLTVTLMGIALANQRWAAVKHIIEFKENLRVILISSLFVLLAARLRPADLEGLDWRLAAFLAVLILVARPVATLASTFASDLSWRERMFVALIAPRGIVAAAMASLFALELANANEPGADRIVSVVFSTILVTVTLYGVFGKWFARWLGVSTPDSDGFVFVGAHDWVREIARALRDQGVAVLLVDTNRRRITQARLEGLEAWCGSVTSPRLGQDLDLGTYNHLLAMTSNDDANALAAVHFHDDFGRADVYQLVPAEAEADEDRRDMRHLRGRYLFEPQATYGHLESRFGRGAEIRATTLTDAFDAFDLVATHGDDVIMLFAVGRGGSVRVATTQQPLEPVPGEVVVSVVGPKTGSQKSSDERADATATREAGPETSSTSSGHGA